MQLLTLHAQYAEQGLRNGRVSVRPSIPSRYRSTAVACGCLLMSNLQTEDIQGQLRALAPGTGYRYLLQAPALSSKHKVMSC